MKQKNIIKNYFTGHVDWEIAGYEYLKQDGNGCFINPDDEECYNFLLEVKKAFDNYTDTLPPEIIEMEIDHHKNKKPFGDYFNIIAPTAVIKRVNNNLNMLAKSIEQPERIKQIS